jgi:glycosyltransferase involved in cell wall biosynthesis
MNHLPRNERPLVSIIVPAYNAERFLPETLRSIQEQTFSRFQALVVDDGSVDGTVEVVRQFSASDRRIRLVQRPNGGVAAARNLGFAQSVGDFVAFIDADDVWYSHALEKLFTALVNSPEAVGLAYAYSVHLDAAGRPNGGFSFAPYEGDTFLNLLVENFISNGSGALLKRGAVEQSGGFDERFAQGHCQGCEDWDFYLRLSEHWNFAVVPEFLVGYRRTPESMSGNHTSMERSYNFMMEQAVARYPDLPRELLSYSRSNFYIHLANESLQRLNHSRTLYWLARAFRADPRRMLVSRCLYSWTLRSALALAARPTRPLRSRPEPLRFPPRTRGADGTQTTFTFDTSCLNRRREKQSVS